MHVGKLVFAQLMEHLPWKTFGRIVERYGGDHRVREFSCAQQFRFMAFAQLSLRDIATCLRAQSAKLYHLGLRGNGGPQHIGRRQRSARLAHLCRVRPTPDPHRALCVVSSFLRSNPSRATSTVAGRCKQRPRAG